MPEQNQQEQVATWWQPDKTDYTVFSFIYPNRQPFMAAVKGAKSVAEVRQQFDSQGVIAGREPYTGSPVEFLTRPDFIVRPVDPFSEGVARQDPDK
jgi:hypothetical protein